MLNILTKPRPKKIQSGASLIEVLIAILLLSFGMLSLGGMLSFAVQAPKLSGYRATAVSLASAHVERIRANPNGFIADAYTSALSYDGTTASIALANCSYPNCTESTLAAMDNAATKQAARIALPAGGMIMKCDTSPCTASSYGNLWIVWQEPTTYSALSPTSSDNCPTEVTGTYTNPSPRCLYVRFKI
jgi:type IV pilus assembly protein PilV